MWLKYFKLAILAVASPNFWVVSCTTTTQNKGKYEHNKHIELRKREADIRGEVSVRKSETVRSGRGRGSVDGVYYFIGCDSWPARPLAGDIRTGMKTPPLSVCLSVCDKCPPPPHFILPPLSRTDPSFLSIEITFNATYNCWVTRK